MARRAYAISGNGHAAFMFASAELRDIAVEHVAGIKPCKCADYRKVERLEGDSVDQWGNVTRYSPYCVYDMGILENWDCEGGWTDAYWDAHERGII